MSATNAAKSPGQASTTNESETSSTGFLTFWKKSDKSASEEKGVKVVQHDPSVSKSGRGGGRLKRFLKTRSASSEKSEDSGPSEAQKRRQQVYQAQKRHRNRKQEYTKSLEAEIARLQQMDSIAHSERNVLAHQNQQMKKLLASHSLDFQLESMALRPTTTAREDLEVLGNAAIDIRYDPEIGHDRTFMDFLTFENTAWTTTESSNSESLQSLTPLAKQGNPVAGDSWAAVDFILALEWPCQGHLHHHGINPDATKPIACDVGLFHGHALTATAAVYESALPPPVAQELQSPGSLQVPSPQIASNPSTQNHWQLPHSEIEKLVQMSQELPLDDDEMTPAQAYSAVRQTVASDEDLKPILEALKIPLAKIVECRGFGAVMPADKFWQYLEMILQRVQQQGPQVMES